MISALGRKQRLDDIEVEESERMLCGDSEASRVMEQWASGCSLTDGRLCAQEAEGSGRRRGRGSHRDGRPTHPERVSLAQGDQGGTAQEDADGAVQERSGDLHDRLHRVDAVLVLETVQDRRSRGDRREGQEQGQKEGEGRQEEGRQEEGRQEERKDDKKKGKDKENPNRTTTRRTRTRRRRAESRSSAGHRLAFTLPGT